MSTTSTNPEALPPLPEPVVVEADNHEATDEGDRSGFTTAYPNYPAWHWFRSLEQGCWLTKFTPRSPSFLVPFQHGTIRIERDGTNTIASGDLYNYVRRLQWQPGDRFGDPNWRWITDPEPDPSDGVPVFVRKRYHSYLRITRILESFTFGSSFTLGFERRRLNTSTGAWSNDGAFTAQMKWITAPAGYPKSSAYLEGHVKDSSGQEVGTLSMGWVSKYYRSISVELDSVDGSEIAVNSGNGHDWRSVMDDVGWEVTVDESHRNVAAPGGASWSKAEMHAALLANRNGSSLDREWRYHLLHVRQIDTTSRGIMYDAYGSDSNNVPREGAGISTHWEFPDEDPWGLAKGDRFGASSAPFFRTAVHELGHAFGLHHLTTSGRFMNTTNLIAARPGTFPNNIGWEFDPADLRRLRHWPDPRVRPGGVPFGQPYSGTPISPADEHMVDVSDVLDASAATLRDAVPLGAPVRVDLSLTNIGESELPTPPKLGFTNDVVSGRVIDPAGTSRRFSTVIHCLDEEELTVLAPDESVYGALTLLRGPDGPLFGSIGHHTVVVDLSWSIDGIEVGAEVSTTVIVTPPEDDAHAGAARVALDTPDLLLTLAIGGDHLEDGVEALNTVMDNPVLAPHYAVVAAKRIGRRFCDRRADVEQAAKLITDESVVSANEAVSLADMIAPATKKTKDKAAVRAMADVLRSKADAAVLSDDDVTTLKEL